MIDVMISSTSKDLYPARKAVQRALEISRLVNIVGAPPAPRTSRSSSPFIATTDIAERCHLLILLLGGRFGYRTSLSKSATEVEFDAAYHADPTKILIFRKRGIRVESRQRRFILKVTNYSKGYWVTDFTSAHELEKLVNVSILTWLKDRAALGYKLNCFDHFLRIARQRVPNPNAKVFHSLSEDSIEMKYAFDSRVHAIHFQKKQIQRDFWGCIEALEKHFAQWRKV